MERCLEIVDEARPKSSVIWQTHNSPPRNASSIRTRLSSASALVMFMNSRISIFRQITKQQSHILLDSAITFLQQCVSHGCAGKGRAGSPLPPVGQGQRNQQRSPLARRAGDRPPYHPRLTHYFLQFGIFASRALKKRLLPSPNHHFLSYVFATTGGGSGDDGGRRPHPVDCQQVAAVKHEVLNPSKRVLNLDARAAPPLLSSGRNKCSDPLPLKSSNSQNTKKKRKKANESTQNLNGGPARLLPRRRCQRANRH